MDFTLPVDHERLRERVRDFVEREMRPIATAREKADGPLERFPWELITAASKELGLRTLNLRVQHGGAGADDLAQALVLEELSAGDMGIAQAFRAQYVYLELFNAAATADQRERFLPDLLADHRCLLAGGMTEPTTGSDHSLPLDAVDAGPHTSAVREGDHYRINGRKTLITNAGVARYYFIWARTVPSRAPSKGTSWFLVPAEADGLRIGRVYEKLGQRLATNAEVVLEDCLVPAGNLFGAEGQAASLGIYSNPAMGAAQAIGAARSAYEAALARARWRVQGGAAIIEHQAIAAILAEMAIGLEAARTLVWRACRPAPGESGHLVGMMAKVLATEMASDVTRRAIQVFGGYGVVEDYPVEKSFRDAATLFHPAAATNQVMLQRIAARLPADGTLSPYLREAACRYVGELRTPLIDSTSA